MAGNLNASIFLNFQYKFKERCTTLFIDAYNKSISNNSISVDFEENDITAILHNYIDENPKRLKWKISTNRENHEFDKNATQEKGFAAKFSRIDMRFSKFWNTKEYNYFVEAKNLKSNDSGLKRRYISTGIDNFLKGGKYFDCDGFLVGYILEGTVEDCKDRINKLLVKDKRQYEILSTSSYFLSIDNYFSKHSEKTIYHLLLNYVN